jgi:purine-binding chemotaxis protein CheW
MKHGKVTTRGKEPTGIDWRNIHHRLEMAQAGVEQTRVPTEEEKKKILKERAKTLAREPQKKPGSEEHVQIVEFALSDEKYGIPSLYVREVYPLKDLTPIPCTPSFVLGVVNVRGQILSVIDIKKLFDLPEKGLSNLNKVIVLHSPAMELGVLADAILDIRSIPLNGLQPSLPTLTGIRREYLKGVTPERVVVLDAEKLLSDQRIIVHEHVEEQTSKNERENP